MSDIVERLRRKVFKNPQVGAPHERTVEWQAADEIERLREALREIRDYEGNFPVIYDGDDAIAMKKIARAALGEKE